MLDMLCSADVKVKEALSSRLLFLTAYFKDKN